MIFFVEKDLSHSRVKQFKKILIFFSFFWQYEIFSQSWDLFKDLIVNGVQDQTASDGKIFETTSYIETKIHSSHSLYLRSDKL